MTIYIKNLKIMLASKSMVLPIIGMIILAVFNTLAYVRDSVLLEKLLLCSFILTVIFILRILVKSN